jgi:hypothetical protein
MKKLQGVVPNMDKQTNTSEMLDEAVEYIRSLQKKVQELTNIVAELRGQEYSRDDSWILVYWWPASSSNKSAESVVQLNGQESDEVGRNPS